MHSWFGENEGYFRIVTFLLHGLSILVLFLVLFKLSNSFFGAALPGLLWYTSPILIYYSSNFLSNMPALSFAVMGFASAYYFLHSKRYKWLIAAAVFYAIAGLFKVTALLSLVALVGALGLSYLIKVRELNWRELVPLVLEVIPSFLWIAYAKYYNEDHLCYYFSTQLYPIWELDFNGIVYHLDLIHKAWAGQFYPTITLVILAYSLVTILFLIRRYSLVVKL